MITKSNSVSRIVEIEHFYWKEGVFDVEARDHSLLGFRIHGSANFENEEGMHKIKTNDILYLPQGMAYKASYSDTDMIAIHFITRRRDTKIQIHTPRDPERFYRLFLKAREIWKEKKPGYDTFAMAQLYTILGTLEEEATKSVLPPSFLSAVAHINQNFTDPELSVDRICAETGISATSFRQFFRNHYQQTPTEYVTGLRLEHARKQISAGKTVERAAYDSGFSDPKYFARVVKKHFGCTPRSFKTYGK